MELKYIGGSSSQLNNALNQVMNKQYNNWLTEDTHIYEIKLQLPTGDKHLKIPVKTKDKSEDQITNEIIQEINSQLGGLVQATKLNKPVKKLSLKIHAKDGTKH